MLRFGPCTESAGGRGGAKGVNLVRFGPRMHLSLGLYYKLMLPSRAADGNHNQ